MAKKLLRGVKLKTIIVEFTGVSGSGKTTYCNAIYNELKHRKVKVQQLSPKKKNLIGVKGLLFNPIKSIKLLNLTYQYQPTTFKKFIKGAWKIIKIIKIYDYYHNNPALYLEDEGFFQKIGKISYNSHGYDKCDIIDRFSKEIHMPDAIFYIINTPQNIAFNRHKRDGKKVKISKNIEAFNRRFSSLKACAEHLGISDSLYSINNSDQSNFDLNMIKIINVLSNYSNIEK